LLAVILAAFALKHYSFTMKFLICLSIILVMAPVYALPLPGEFDLQVDRIPILLAIPLWLVPVFLPPYRPLRIRLSWPVVWFGLFTVYVLLSTVLLSQNPRTAVSQLAALVVRGAILFWLPQVILRRSDLYLTAKALLASGLILVGFAVYQYVAWLTGWNRVGYAFVLPFGDLMGMRETLVAPTGRMGPLFRLTLPFGSSSHLGPAIAAVLLVAVGLWLHFSKKRTWKALGLLVYCLVLFGLLLGTYSRAAWLGFAAGLLTMLLLQRRLIRKKRVWRIVVVGVMILCIGAIVYMPFVDTVLERFDRGLTQGSDEGHLKFFLTAAAFAAENPILGIGWANFEARTGALHAHNVYMNILAEGGLIGLLLWLMLCGSLVLVGVRAVLASPQEGYLRYWNLGLLAALISILVNNLFQVSYLYGFVWMIAGLTVASFHITVREAAAQRGGVA
jgi:O-antigen ligase